MINRDVIVRNIGKQRDVPIIKAKFFLQILSAVLAFLFARTGVMGEYAPFGLAYICAISPNFLFLSAIGCVIGHLFSNFGVLPMRYIVTIIAIILIKKMFVGVKNIWLKDLISSGSCMICTFLTGIILIIAQSNVSAITVISTFSEALLAGGCAFFFRRFFIITENTRGFSTLNNTEISCVLIIVCISLMALAPIEFFGISIGRILMAFTVLMAARYGKEVGGSITGIAIGVTLSALGDKTMVSSTYAFGGLLAGVFSRTGSVVCAVAFLVANAFGIITSQGANETLFGLYESLIACVGFVLVPYGVVEKIENYFNFSSDMPSNASVKSSIVSRLDFAANAMADVSESVELVSEKLSKIAANDFDGVYRQVQENVCKKCGLKMYCWEKNFNSTSNIFNRVSTVLQNNGKAKEDDIPDYFQQRCIKLPELINSFNLSYSDYLLRESAQSRISEIRGVVADQFESMADILSDLAVEFDTHESYDERTATRVIYVMRGFGIEPNSVTCKLDKYERMTIEINFIKSNLKVDRIKLGTLLDEACDRCFDLPQMTTLKDETKITLCERANLRVQRGACQICSHNAPISGDAYECFNDGQGREIIVLSDGMGSGGRAAVDGAMASSLVARLSRAGVGFDCTLRVVNSALLVKSSDESLATLDVACIDLYTGKVDVYKAGACATYLRKNGKAQKIEQNSLAAGILRKVEFVKTTARVADNDIVMIISDGVINGDDGWIFSELECWRDGSAKQLAEHIANQAKRRRLDGHEDDITVIVSFIKQC